MIQLFFRDGGYEGALVSMSILTLRLTVQMVGYSFWVKGYSRSRFEYRDFQAGSLLGRALKTNMYRKVKGTGFGWKENLNCDAVSQKISTGFHRKLWSFNNPSELLCQGKIARILYFYTDQLRIQAALGKGIWSWATWLFSWGNLSELIPEGFQFTCSLAARKEAL